MLVNQNRIAIRVKNEKTCRSSPILCFLFKCNTGFFELFLHVADVSKRWYLLAMVVLVGNEGEHVLLKHALHQADVGLSIGHQEPMVCFIAGSNFKAQRFVKKPGGLKVFHVQTE